MIEPIDADRGRKVVYRGGEALEEGVIASFNPAYVFVRYGADAGSKATLRKDLEWVAGQRARDAQIWGR
jgi:hypothetical protein